MPNKNFRTSASFGKRQEFVAMGELLRRGFDVYSTLVDDQQIDCIIRKDINGKLVYMDIQIKARSKECKPYDAARFAAMDIIKPRKNYFFIFYSERVDTYWVFPSLDVATIASRNKRGANIGKYHMNLCGYSEKGNEVYPLPRYNKWQNNFEILENYQG